MRHPTAASQEFPCQTCEVRDKAICSALSDEELRELCRITTEVNLHRSQAAFYEGDENTYLFNVVTGSLRLSKMLSDGRRQITGFLFPGDFLGLSVTDVYAYSAEALTEATLCRFKRTSLLKLLDRFPKLEHRLLELASNELVEAQTHLVMLGQKSAMERLTSTLLRLMERIGHDYEGGSMIDLPMTREDLADYAGLRFETVSRCFSQLRKKGVILLKDKGSVLVPHPEALERLAGD